MGKDFRPPRSSLWGGMIESHLGESLRGDPILSAPGSPSDPAGGSACLTCMPFHIALETPQSNRAALR